MKSWVVVFTVLSCFCFQALALPLPGLGPEHRDLVGQWVFTGGFCQGWSPEQVEKYQSELNFKSYYEQLSINAWDFKAEQLTIVDPEQLPVDPCYRSVLYKPKSNVGYVILKLEHVESDPKCPVDNELSLAKELALRFSRRKNPLGKDSMLMFYYGIAECGDEPFVAKYRQK